MDTLLAGGTPHPSKSSEDPYVIETRDWNHSRISRLLEEDGSGCVIGLCALQDGIDASTLLAAPVPEDIGFVWDGFTEISENLRLVPTPLAKQAISINDRANTFAADKMEQLVKLFQEYGKSLIFTYNGAQIYPNPEVVVLSDYFELVEHEVLGGINPTTGKAAIQLFNDGDPFYVQQFNSKEEVDTFVKNLQELAEKVFSEGGEATNQRVTGQEFKQILEVW